MSALEAVDFAPAADPASWVRECERSYPKVYRGVVAMGATEHDAADALQDAFEQALRITRPPTKPEGWLFVVALRSWRRHRWRGRLFRPLSAAIGRHRLEEHDERIDLLGYVLSAAAVMAHRPVADGLVLLYAVGLVLAYATSRGELPVEPIGLATKAAETIVAAICTFLVLRRPPHTVSGG